jgi:tRNA pseudouridine55 synthase
MAALLHLVDKPEGWTSHDAVARLRSILGVRRVGHSGTLDPFATGLLVAAEGRATGLLSALGLLPKRYRATVRLGVATDTHARRGAPVRAAPESELPSRAAVDEALERFRGATEQLPPLYSAVKIGGERLYRAARRGESVERPTRTVHVYAMRRVATAEREDTVTLDLTVSRGTYVRTLAHDLGEALGCGAHLAELRRLGIGPFDVARAGRVERDGGWDAETFRARAARPEEALAFLPRVKLDAREAGRLRDGVAPVHEAARVEESDAGYPLPPGATGWPLALLAPEGALLALALPVVEQVEREPLRLQRVVA